jgi:hypothetical protein
MSIDSNWSFNELICNIERLKQEYIFFLAFFSSSNKIDDKRRTNTYIKEIRDKFYKINIKEWQIDLCWEFMNDYITYFDLIHVLHKLDKKRKK